MSPNMILRCLLISFVFFTQVAYAAGESGSPILDFAYKVINFTALVGIIVFFAKKPVSAMIRQKAVAEKEDISQVEQRLEYLEKELSLKKRELDEYKTESETILAEARLNAANEERKIIAEAQLRSEKMKEQAIQTIQHGYSKAQADLLEWAACHLVEDVGGKLKELPQLGDVVTQYKNVSA